MAQVNLGSVYGSLELDTTKWTKGLNDAKSSLDAFSKQAQNAVPKDILGNSTAQFKTMTNVLNGAFDGLKQLGTIGVVAGTALSGFGVFSGMAAARIDELTLALHAVAKANGLSTQAADDAVRSLRANNIAYDKSLQIVANFITANLDMADAIKLSNAAKDLAVVAGMDSSAATETLTQAIVTNQTQQLAQFGILTTQTQAFNDYAKTVGKSANDLTQLEKQQAILNTVLAQGERVVGTYDAAYGSVSKRWRSLTGRILPDFIAELGKVFSPALTVVVDSITQKIGVLTNQIGTMKDGVFVLNPQIEQFGQKLADVAKQAIGIFDKVFAWLLANKEVVVGALVAIGVGLVALGAAFVVAHAPAILLFGAITALVVAFQKLPVPVLILLTSVLVALGYAILATVVPGLIAGAGAAFTFAAGVIAATWPVLLIILAIGALIAIGYVLWKNWDKIGAFFAGIWQNTIVPAWNKAVATLKAIVENIKYAIISSLLGVWIGILGAWQKAHDFLINTATSIANAIVSGFNSVITFFTVTLPNAIMTFVTKTLPAFAVSAVNFFINMFLQWAASFLQGIGFILGLIIYGIPMLVTTIINFFVALPDKIKEILLNVALQFTIWIIGVIAYLSVAIPALIQSIGDWLKALPGVIWNWLVTTWNNWVTWRDNVYKTVYDGIIALLKGIGDWLSKLPSIVWDWLTKTFNNFKTWGTQTYNYLATQVSQIIANVVSWFASLPSKIMTALTNLGSTIKTTFTNAYSDLIKEVSTWPAKLAEWGMNVAKSFADGFTKIGEWIKDKLKKGLDDAKKWLKGQSPPVAGPLKDIDKWGFNVGSAWVQGFGNAFGSIDQALSAGMSGFAGVGVRPAIAPATVQGNTSNATYNVYIGMYAGSAMEKREIAKQLSDALTDYQKGVGIYE